MRMLEPDELGGKVDINFLMHHTYKEIDMLREANRKIREEKAKAGIPPQQSQEEVMKALMNSVSAVAPRGRSRKKNRSKK